MLRLVAFAAVGALAFVGCSVESGPESAGEPQAEEGAETLTVELEGSVAHAVRIDASQVRVDIYDRAGVLQFSADYRAIEGQMPSVAWTLFQPAAAGEPAAAAASGALEVEMDELPTLDGAVTGAALIHAQVSRADSSEAYDNWGCDLLPGAYNGIVSCGTKGACCDVHDACFATYGCNAGSWTRPWDYAWQCSAICNAGAVGCFTSLHPGPSECCWLGNCGQPR
ncbi:hypothetical protein BE04_42940 [Sorangium cellulosum]|uniref:Uncharacterized protein n=1 Tax=Sorangium cellulosum TaxID=56 RepID=A0A150PX12_SORCE|nr:hypothetical protein BE04_42940 [Sorangium cellulosum]KYG08509.1 hypothetical protein BE21_23305 [Sorangium cellulosum]